ncbi:MAG TPA: 4'-phosphopantetheinyl transferase superfamily protein [Pyrinomonadaceae bacterium]|nr:4'-phosphopantetheinyl transferase superfamily protein [Pyrinomonadaceae bacterium]
MPLDWLLKFINDKLIEVHSAVIMAHALNDKRRLRVRDPSRSDIGETNLAQRSSETDWQSPPASLALETNEVHLWRANLQVPAGDLARLHGLLSPDERARAKSYRFERDRERFIVARGFLRTILGLYLDCGPAALHFNYAEHGKPSLADPVCEDASLNFNLAHSGKLAIYGITRRRALGVDLELIRPDLTGEDIARRFFSANDTASLLAIPASRRQRAFYDGWTRKEAFIKAKGSGLLLPLDQFDVALSPGEPAALLRTGWDLSEASRWSLRAIDVAPDYAAAIAVEGHDWRLRCWLASVEILRWISPNRSVFDA